MTKLMIEGRVMRAIEMIPDDAPISGFAVTIFSPDVAMTMETSEGTAAETSLAVAKLFVTVCEHSNIEPVAAFTAAFATLQRATYANTKGRE
jgi:hypothetical protein